MVPVDRRNYSPPGRSRRPLPRPWPVARVERGSAYAAAVPLTALPVHKFIAKGLARWPLVPGEPSHVAGGVVKEIGPPADVGTASASPRHLPIAAVVLRRRARAYART